MCGDLQSAELTVEMFYVRNSDVQTTDIYEVIYSNMDYLQLQIRWLCTIYICVCTVYVSLYCL